jgi:hypothetical protein
VVAIVGAFFPERAINRLTGNGTMKIKGIEITFGGSIRTAVIVCGVFILALAGIETYMKLSNEQYRIHAKLGTKVTIAKEYDESNKLFNDLVYADRSLRQNIAYLDQHGFPKECYTQPILLSKCGGLINKADSELHDTLDFKLAEEEDKTKYLAALAEGVRTSPSIWKVVYWNNCTLGGWEMCSILKAAIDRAD